MCYSINKLAPHQRILGGERANHWHQIRLPTGAQGAMKSQAGTQSHSDI